MSWGFDTVEHMFETIKPETDPVAAIKTQIEILAGEDRDHWPASALSDRLVEMVETLERLAAEATRLAGRWDRQQAWAIDGSLSGSGWLTRKTPIGKTKARRLVAAGRMTVDHPVVEEALVAGDVTVDHVEVLARVAAVNHRAELVADHVETLIDTASGLVVDDFSVAANTWAMLADDQATDRSFMEQHRRRGLYLAPTFDGVVAVDGSLDPVGGATVITALDHAAPPDPADTPDGPRSLAQRRADALVELAETYLSGTDRTAASVTVNAVVDVARLTGNPPDGPGTARCDVDRVGPVGRVSMERLGVAPSSPGW